MAPERWREVERLYHAALELADTERAAFLEQACGADNDLRQYVEKMLASDAKAGGFLESPAMQEAARMLAAEGQAASPKSRIGHYQILEKLGTGGMGIVYKALDTRLGRFAALKFLPDTVAHDRLAVERFQREARVASSLDHPNICTIYEVGEDAGRPFIAMQYLEGQTLQHRIEEKSLNTDSLFDLAVQIAEALDAAHSKGIIHRDIKPGNIFITSRGDAKILDFGLAKLKTEAGGRLTDLTGAGMAMGTAAYMSPEQARGEGLDFRTDLFSFGAVLYEMATGRQAFSGATTALIHDAILHSDPPLPSAVNPSVPAGLDAIVMKALEKHRELRCQSAAELRADLKRLKRDTESGRSMSAVPGVRIRKRRRWPWAAAALVCVALAVTWSLWRSGPRPAPIMERQLTASFGSMVVEAAISPDGNSLAYADNAGLHVSIIDTGEIHDLQWLPGVRISQIVWFPNNRDLLISAMPGFGTRTKLWTTSIFGGAPRLLRDDVRDVAVSWSGSRIAFTPNAVDSLWVMNSDGEEARKLLSAPEGYSFAFPCWYPGDKTILYASAAPRFEKTFIKSFSLETGQPGLFSASDNSPWEFRVLRNGRLLTLVGEPQVNSVAEINAGLSKLLPVGSARLIRQWPEMYVFRPSVSADGRRMTFLKRMSEMTVFVADIKDGGKRLENVRRLVHSGMLNTTRGWTPDGSAVVFDIHGNHRSSWDISRQNLDSTTAQPLVTSQEEARYGRFTSDGKWLLYLLRKQNGDVNLMRMPASGGLAQRLWMNSRLHNYYCTAAPVNFCVAGVLDRNQMVFYRIDPAANLPAEGAADLREVGRTAYDPSAWPSGWALSPDGSKVATVKPDINEGRIHVVPLARDGGKHASPPYDVILKGWTDLVTINWAHQGKGWYVSSQMVRSTGSFLYVDLAGNATALSAPDSFVAEWGVPSPDGRHLAFSSYPGIQNVWLLENF